MPANLEIKARISSISTAEMVARSIGAKHVGVLTQTDTYFYTRVGRLKLREIEEDHSELISYVRSESTDRRLSEYQIYLCSDPIHLKNVLTESLGIRSVVKKRRTLYLFQTTRIHLDEVEGLGSYLELESPIVNSRQDAEAVVEFLVSNFSVKEKDYIRSSYVDLIERSGSPD